MKGILLNLITVLILYSIPRKCQYENDYQFRFVKKENCKLLFGGAENHPAPIGYSSSHEMQIFYEME